MNMCINKMKLRTFNAGDKIIKKGSIGISMFFIDLGTARAEIRGHTAQTLKSGDYFGELAFLKKKPRACTVTASGDNVKVAYISRASFDTHLGPAMKRMKAEAAKYSSIPTE